MLTNITQPYFWKHIGDRCAAITQHKQQIKDLRSVTFNRRNLRALEDHQAYINLLLESKD